MRDHELPLSNLLLFREPEVDEDADDEEEEEEEEEVHKKRKKKKTVSSKIHYLVRVDQYLNALMENFSSAFQYNNL